MTRKNENGRFYEKNLDVGTEMLVTLGGDYTSSEVDLDRACGQATVVDEYTIKFDVWNTPSGEIVKAMGQDDLINDYYLLPVVVGRVREDGMVFDFRPIYFTVFSKKDSAYKEG